jgi:hypothetical protein
MKDTKQTPASKVSSGKDLSEKKTPELKKTMANAKKGADNATSATKTPQKIQDDKMGRA